MPLPHVVARANKRFTDRFIEPVLRRSSRFVRVHHVGRRSRAAYSTPLWAFGDGTGAAFVVLTYGPRADWVRNVQAGDARLEREGETRRIDAIEIVGRAEAWPFLPRLVRVGVRLLSVTDFARITTREDETTTS